MGLLDGPGAPAAVCAFGVQRLQAQHFGARQCSDIAGSVAVFGTPHLWCAGAADYVTASGTAVPPRSADGVLHAAARSTISRTTKHWRKLVVRLKHRRCLPILFVMSEKPSNRPKSTRKAHVAAVRWWAWVGAAILSHVALRAAAGPQDTQLLQYLVPALFIVVGAATLRARRATGAAPGGNSDSVDVQTLRWREFETLVAFAFKLQGYHISETGAAGSDASVDLMIRKERQTYLVHCKAWRAEKVSIETVQTARAAMQARGAVGCFVLSAGRFSREAAAAANLYNIRAIAGPALQALLLQGRAQAAREERAQGDPTGIEPAQVAVPPPVAPVAPVAPIAKVRSAPSESALAELALPCPLCGGEMKARTAKRGVNAGHHFWGCIRHPDCRGTRRVRTHCAPARPATDP